MSAYTYEYAVPINMKGTPADVFTALTDAGALKVWFAEHAEVEPEEGGAYHFWGRYSLEPKEKSGAMQVITRFEPGKVLGFRWNLLGRDSEVTWLMEPAEADRETKITVRHAFAEEPEGNRVKEMIDDLWRLNTGNLCHYLIGERPVFRPDFDDPNPEVRHEIVIQAPRSKVFAAITKPDYIKQWFPAPAPFVEPHVGGKYGFGFSFERDGETITPPPMEILEYEENERLAITWPDWRGDASVPDQKITWILADYADGTRLTLIHSGFIRTVDVSDYPFGWVEFMGKIRDVAEGL